MADSHDRCKQYAASYDEKSVESAWYGPAVLFGLMYTHVRSGQSLLDLGIGTGLGSALFHKAGLRITGIDNSASMLAQCNKKKLSQKLIHHDLTEIPWPCSANSFGHVVSTGVLHFIGELNGIFSEVARVIKPGGVFGFDFDEYKAGKEPGYTPVINGVYCRLDREYGETLFRHSEEYVRDRLIAAGFEIVDNTEFLVSRERKTYFKVIVARRQ